MHVGRFVEDFLDTDDIVIGDMETLRLSEALTRRILFWHDNHLRAVSENEFSEANQSGEIAWLNLAHQDFQVLSRVFLGKTDAEYRFFLSSQASFPTTDFQNEASFPGG